ncbi:MAG: hypothetical protein NT106_09970 [Candidatus Sumerlaeota bacterium]|nr:hypothetical protein [Candidatus Sumerlaeota bacterium]
MLHIHNGSLSLIKGLPTLRGSAYKINAFTVNNFCGCSVMKQNKFPPGWDDEQVQRVLEHYETQSEEESFAEDEAAYEDSSQTFMEIPNELVPKVRELLAKRTT